MGAGVIPTSFFDNKVHFLFQKAHTGRKVGHLIDFGGGLGEGESHRQTAVREFVEETDTLYFAPDPRCAARTEAAVAAQIPVVAALFEETQRSHAHWWRRRAPGNGPTPKDWITFFVRFPFRDVTSLNGQWAGDHIGRFKKRRELVWLTTAQLLEIYEGRPQLLWKRVRQLEDAPGLIQEIERSLRSP